MGLRSMSRFASPRVAVAVTVAVSFVVHGARAQWASIPHVFMDELYFMEPGVSIAEGHGLTFRGEPWGYLAPVMPLLFAAIVTVTNDQETTVGVAKLVNAAAFAAATVPVYLLARRLLPPWPSAGAAALAGVIPASFYVASTMTESVGYLVASCAVYFVALVLERPTVPRQLAAVGTTFLAAGVRPQLISLYLGYLVSLALLALLSEQHRARLRAAPKVFWPTAVSLVVPVVLVARSLLAGEPARSLLGSYEQLATGYEPLEVARWFLYSTGNLGLYLAVIPFAVAPVALQRVWSRARAGSAPDAAYLSLFAAVNLALLALVTAHASKHVSAGVVHDRYLFYLVPLWLLLVVVWLHDGMPGSRGGIAAGAVAAVALVVIIPPGDITSDEAMNKLEAAATSLLGMVGIAAGALPSVSPRLIVLASATMLALVVVSLPRLRPWVIVGCIVAVFVANASIGWRRALVDPTVFGAGPRGTRSWVDDELAGGERATVLYVERDCDRLGEEPSLLLTEIFNRSVDRAVTVGGTGRGNPPSIGVRQNGELRFESGRPFVSRFVVTQPGIELVGTRLASGMPTDLVLWETDGPVTAARARSDLALRSTGCLTQE